MNVLISACLIGTPCRYDGKSAPLSGGILDKLKNTCHLIPVCPEIFGGLPTPRLPAEHQNGRVLRRDGADITDAYLRGAREVLRLARFFDCHYAILKERSPSCGKGRIYDGTFSGVLTSGDGITASLLKENGIIVFGESDIPTFLSAMM